jgi:hypothetical protein
VPCPPPTLADAHFVGLLQTLSDLSAKGFPLGTDNRAAFSGLLCKNFDPLRTAWRELAASAGTLTTWHRGTDAPA